MRRHAWILMALGMAMSAHAQDWLAGDYDVVVPDRPAPKRFLLTITQDADGRYREQVFEEVVDASTGRTSLRPAPEAGDRDSVVRELTPDELSAKDGVDLLPAHVRCAFVGGMMLCHIPDGPGLALEDRTLPPGYFTGAMHVGFMEVHKRPPAAPGDHRGNP
jgi:hypothetical protein